MCQHTLPGGRFGTCRHCQAPPSGPLLCILLPGEREREREWERGGKGRDSSVIVLTAMILSVHGIAGVVGDRVVCGVGGCTCCSRQLPDEFL